MKKSIAVILLLAFALILIICLSANAQTFYTANMKKAIRKYYRHLPQYLPKKAPTQRLEVITRTKRKRAVS